MTVGARWLCVYFRRNDGVGGIPNCSIWRRFAYSDTWTLRMGTSGSSFGRGYRR